MSGITGNIRALKSIQDEIRGAGTDGLLMVTDLARSTPYKTQNGEDAWLTRLFDFYDAVGRGLHPFKPSKYLGDGVFTFLRSDQMDPAGMVQLAEQVHAAISETNVARGHRGEHRICVRSILASGHVFLYQEADPQGTPVDTLFRMEKLVPEGCIGLLDPIAEASKRDRVYVGAYRLKGLAGGRQRLWLLRDACDERSEPVRQARILAAMHDLWDLGDDAGGKIHVINGYVPELTGAPASIQLGDMRAEQRVYANLVCVGRGADILPMTTRDYEEGHLRENVICLGGPYWNAATSRMMQELRLPLRFDLSAPDDRTPLLDGLHNRTYAAQWEDGCLSRDYGFLVRARNPLNERRHVIIVAGIETHAVGGVVDAFSMENTCFMDLYQAVRGGDKDEAPLDEFYSVLPFTVERSGRTALPSRNEQQASVVRTWGREGTWVSQAARSADGGRV